MAAKEFPISFKDPLYAELDARTEQKLGLPSGLLASIRLNGERTNADKVSEVGARTPYQVIPETRAAVIKKYGIDPLLSPENASEVAGLLLKESLQRNKGDVTAAVGEYIGGTDRKNWGRTTNAYIQRVTGALGATGQAGQTQGKQSRFAAGVADAAPSASIAKVYEAYKAGQMTAQEAADFEADVKSGAVMLPRGAQMGDPSADVIPQSVLAAYTDGRMTPDEKAQLEADVRSGAVKLPSGMQLNAGRAMVAVPGMEDTAPPAAEPGLSVMDRIIGTGEAALTTGTGIVGGTLGMIGGGVGAGAAALMNGDFGTPQAANAIEQAAARGGQSLTYAPRTQEGQRQAGVVGQAMQQVLPILPVAGSLGPAGALSTAAGAVRTGAAATLDKAGAAARTGAQAARERVAPQAAPSAGTMGSGGAAATDMAAQRTATAGGLPVPIKLTRGQATRDFEQLRFEKETAKDPTRGAPLRENADRQAKAIAQNFDELADQTGAVAPDLVAGNRAVVLALTKSAAKDKAEVRAAYKKADNAGETLQPVPVADVLAYIEKQTPTTRSQLAPILNTAAEEIAANAQDGMVTIRALEDIRKTIRANTQFGTPNSVHGGEIIKLIDQATEGQGGALYAQARGLRRKYARIYEDRAAIADLIANRKNMADPKVAIDKVFTKSILQSSPDDVLRLRRVLQIGGEEGQQAWKELQNATIQHIKEQATRGPGSDQASRPLLSPDGMDKAVKSLDKNGRLDIVLGRKTAQQIRDLNDINKFVNTAPPGAINTSNTASVLLAAMAEAGATGSLTGLPLPLLSGLRVMSATIKDRRIQKRVQEAIRNEETRQVAKRAGATRTTH